VWGAGGAAQRPHMRAPVCTRRCGARASLRVDRGDVPSGDGGGALVWVVAVRVRRRGGGDVLGHVRGGRVRVEPTTWLVDVAAACSAVWALVT
jgi:hypothetical protein